MAVIPPGRRADYTPIYKRYGAKGRLGVYRYAYTAGGRIQYDDIGAVTSPTISNRAYLTISKINQAHFSTLAEIIRYVESFTAPATHYGYVAAHGEFQQGYVPQGASQGDMEGWRNVQSNERFPSFSLPEVQKRIKINAESYFSHIDGWVLTWL